MQNQPIEHDVKHPISASTGPDNAYYLRHCPVVERGPSYAACLSRLHDIAGGRVNERTMQCERAVREGRCIAKGMREQEELAVTALFYFPRASKPFLPVSVAGDFGVLITNLTDPALIPKPVKPFGVKSPVRPVPTKLQEELQTDVLAQAINNAATAALNAGASMEQVKEAIAAIPPEQLPALPPTVAPAFEPVKMAAEMVTQMASGGAPKIQPGETPLQYARRMAALRNAKQ